MTNKAKHVSQIWKRKMIERRWIKNDTYQDKRRRTAFDENRKMFFFRREEGQEIQDNFYVAGLGRRNFKNFKRHRQPVRKPFGSPVDKETILRQGR